MLKVGLLGAGRIGQEHARAISTYPGSVLGAVSDAVPAAAESLASNYGADVGNLDEIIADA